MTLNSKSILYLFRNYILFLIFFADYLLRKKSISFDRNIIKISLLKFSKSMERWQKKCIDLLRNFLRDQSELLSLFKIFHEILLYLQDEIEIFWRPSTMWLIASCHVKEFFSKTRHPQYSAKGEWRLLAQKLEGAIARFARDYRIWHLTTKKKRFKHSINFKPNPDLNNSISSLSF